MAWIWSDHKHEKLMSAKPILVIDDKKLCSGKTGCGKLKPISEFYRNSEAVSGFSYQCKECRNKSRKEIYSKTDNFQRAARRGILKKFNMTLNEYDELLEKQNGVCAICGEINKHGWRLAVDHDHRTGKIRGLLCHYCNVALGQVNENVNTLSKMITYLTTHSRAMAPEKPGERRKL